MATVDSSAFRTSVSNPPHRQLLLLSLISTLCPPRANRPPPDRRRLIVDSRLAWEVMPVDARSSWLYLPQAPRWRLIADCWVLTADAG